MIYLHGESTTKQIVLSILTLGIYPAFYIKKSSLQLNRELPDNRISIRFINIIIVISIASVVFLISDSIFDNLKTNMLEMTPAQFVKLSDLYKKIVYISPYILDIIRSILFLFSLLLIIAWSFTIKEKLNSLLVQHNIKGSRFSGIWAMLFNIFYINYKINKVFSLETAKKINNESINKNSVTD